MSALARFERYLDEVRALLRREALARAAAGVIVAAALLTVLSVGWLLSRGFPPGQVVALRLLLLVLVLATGTALLLPTWLRLRRHEGAQELERRLPIQGGRIETLLDSVRRERSGEPASPLTELLAADAERVATAQPLEQALPARLRLIPAGIAAAALLGMVALAAFGPQGWGPGARHLWFGQSLPAPALAAARSLQVRPGDATVRRNQDLTVSALIKGVRAGEAKLHVRYADGEWEAAAMRSGTDGKFDLTLYALREPAEYYVSVGGLTSEHYRLALVDLPKITALKLRYDYPAWTGLAPRQQDEDGSISAVAGTRVTVEVEADVPLDQPLLVVDENSAALSTDAARRTQGSGKLTVRKDGHYRIAARFGDEIVALTEDFPITAVADEKPVVEVVRPGRDYQASAIEEVPVRLRATDDYRLDALELRYSVNGGAFQSARLPAGTREIDTAALLNLEDLGQAQPTPKNGGPKGLVPGDLITYYAVARDHSQDAQTDLFMVQVQPFDRRYSEGQGGGGGGGGGGGDDQNGIAERQREILLATFNLTRDAAKAGRDAERRADNARMLSELQITLRDQANTLVERTRARELATADPSIRQFVESLEQAAKEMDPASERLAQSQLEAAIPNEQRALQHLLRAEAAFREIQVARQGGGGGGGGGQAGRDVAEMTELELDLEKNQYETESQLSAQNGAGQQQQDDALRRLKELARRQEQLARENARNPEQPEASRWRQEQLRREAEQLRQELEQLAKQQNSQGQQSGQQGQQGQQGQRGQQGQQGQQRGQQSARAQGQQGGSPSQSAALDAARQLEQALAQQRQGSTEEASRSLNKAIERLERGKQQALGEGFEGLAREAREILDEQRRTEQELGDAVRGFRARQQPGTQRERNASDVFGGLDINSAERLAERKRELQARLEALQSRMQSTTRSGKSQAPQATDKLTKAGEELDESQTTARLARSALEIERGRTTQAASRDGIITESLENLERALSESAAVASTEGQQRGAGEASPDELLAELATLRRAVEAARENAARNGVAQNGAPQPGEGQQGQEGQQGGKQQGGAQGSEGGGQSGRQQGSAQNSEGGGQQGGGQQGGMTAGGGGGSWTGGAWNGGAWNGGGADRGLRPGEILDSPSLSREARATSERLAQLRGRLQRGQLSEVDVKALQELSERLRRAGGDPMAGEYRSMMALVDQLELAALRAGGDASTARITRGNARTEEPARYRENVAEYYRRLGDKEQR